MSHIDGMSVKGYYGALEADRSGYLLRARDVAELTLPHLLPPEGWNGGDLGTPYQSVGARGLLSLTSKLMLALFPPSESFLRLKLGDAAVEAINSAAPQATAEVQKSLAEVENRFVDEVESLALRPGLSDGLKQWLLAGNVTLGFPESGGCRVYQLDRFVRKLDGMGRLMVLILKDMVGRATLPERVLEALKEQLAQEPDPKTNLELYTAIVREQDGKYCVWQEIMGVEVPDSRVKYKPDELPWITLGDGVTSGQSYGYGYMASQLGDLSSLEGLMRSLVEGSAASSRVVFLVSPTSVTRPAELNRAPNGSFVTGQEGDIVALQVNKSADLSVAANTIEALKTSLGFAFLLSQSVQRQGERVTAEEIRYLAQELEDVHAGMYSYLSQSLQLPLAKLLVARMAKRGIIPKIDEKTFKFTIVTGLEALGRGHDVQRLDLLVKGVAELVGAQLGQYVNIHGYLKRRATGLSISDSDDILYTPEQQAQMNAQAQQAQLAQGVAPEVVRQAGAMMQQPQAQ